MLLPQCIDIQRLAYIGMVVDPSDDELICVDVLFNSILKNCSAWEIEARDNNSEIKRIIDRISDFSRIGEFNALNNNDVNLFYLFEVIKLEAEKAEELE